MGIYVETVIRGPLDVVWQRTQDPRLHERWDLRFTSIEYAPRSDEAQPQRFWYSTRIVFGLTICGEGETIATRDGPCRQRTSSLRFWSDDPKSLIREGAGYWKYTPTEDGVRFATLYDYRVRFGRLGRLLDRLVFRPLIGWATAWSFDRLKLWIEKGIDPAASRDRSLIHALCRLTVAFVWFYQGLIPKLITHHADELTLLTEAGLPGQLVPPLLTALGWAEIAMGLAVLGFFRARWPLIMTMALMIAATLTVALCSPRYLSAAFNPVSLNVPVAVMAVIACLTLRDLPRAANCLRNKGDR